MTNFRLNQVTQAQGGLKLLKPNRSPINTPLRVKVSSLLPPQFSTFHRERALASTLQTHTILVPNIKGESLGGKSQVYKISTTSDLFFVARIRSRNI